MLHLQTAVTVQEVFANGLIDRDDRVKPGDQILEVSTWSDMQQCLAGLHCPPLVYIKKQILMIVLKF